MAYANQANRPNLPAMLGAAAVPAAIGGLLIAGLAISKVIDEPDVLTGWQLPDPPTIEPLPDPEPPTATDRAQPSPKVAPTRERPAPLPPAPDANVNLGSSAPITTLPGLGIDDLGAIGPVDFGVPDSAPGAALDPVAAAPRGDPGRWITDDDFRTVWINRGYSGIAGFTLSIDAAGRVTDCSLIRSTGHEALDTATCRLLERRARFDPARNAAGDPVPGTFNSSVNWQIPD